MSDAETPAHGPRRKVRWPLAVVAVVAAGVLCVVAATAGVAGGRTLARSEAMTTATVKASGATREVSLAGPQTVASVLIMAGVVPRDGRLLSAASHRVVDPSLRRASVTIGGAEVSGSTPVTDGATITVVKGADEVEGTKLARVEVPPPPLTDVLKHVYRAGTPGLADEVRGKISGELVRRTEVRAPRPATRATSKVVALTFDDGPSEAWTPLILRVLKEKGVKATFCQVGREVRKHPEISREVLAQGHRLCNHTLNHNISLGTADAATVESEIQGGLDTFTSNGIAAPSTYRPPGGSLSDTVKASAHAKREAILYWKVDTEDWRKGATLARIMANLESEVDNGAIILMHDGGGASRALSAISLGLVIDWLKAQGYGFTFPVVP